MKILRSGFLLGTLAFWLAMTGLLIQKEFFQFTSLKSAYEFLPLQNWDARKDYYAIYLGKELVGFKWNVLEKKETEYEFRHATYLSFAFLGHSREMVIMQKAQLEKSLFLKEFNVRIKTGENETLIKGHIQDRKLETIIENPGSAPASKISPLTDQLFFGDTLDFLWIPENLKIGKQGIFKIWNPLALAAQDVKFHVKRKEKIAFEGKDAEVFRIALLFNDLEISCWVSPQGVVLRSENVSGLVFEKQDAYKIFNALRAKREKPADLPNLFSISSNQILENPEKISYLKVRIRTPQEDKVREIRRSDFSKLATGPLLGKPELSPYLQPSLWIQSDHPEILRKAEEITKGSASTLEKVQKINFWLGETIAPIPTMGIPRASEVLKFRSGDCNEFTVLFTALARAAGVPARMQAGLVYQSGRFFYHAWPEVYLGEWVAFDPTFGQAPADATHIPLIEGDMDKQIALASQIGRIKIFILEAKESI